VERVVSAGEVFKVLNLFGRLKLDVPKNSPMSSLGRHHLPAGHKRNTKTRALLASARGGLGLFALAFAVPVDMIQ
jgi:hypothetical protein